MVEEKYGRMVFMKLFLIISLLRKNRLSPLCSRRGGREEWQCSFHETFANYSVISEEKPHLSGVAGVEEKGGALETDPVALPAPLPRQLNLHKQFILLSSVYPLLGSAYNLEG